MFKINNFAIVYIRPSAWNSGDVNGVIHKLCRAARNESLLSVFENFLFFNLKEVKNIAINKNLKIKTFVK